MPNKSIPDWKKAAIVGLSVKYGDRAISNRIDVSVNTVKKYREEVEENGKLQMDGANLEVVT